MVRDPQVSRCVQRPINYAINYLLITSISSLACFASRPAAGGRALGFLPPGIGMYVCMYQLTCFLVDVPQVRRDTRASRPLRRTLNLPTCQLACPLRPAVFSRLRVFQMARVFAEGLSGAKMAGKIRACVPLHAELPYCTPLAPSPMPSTWAMFTWTGNDISGCREPLFGLMAALCATFELFHTSNYVFAGSTFVGCTGPSRIFAGAQAAGCGLRGGPLFSCHIAS